LVIDDNSKDILRKKLLSIWAKKQTEIETHLEAIEANLDQQNRLFLDKENQLFEYLQGAAHIWDLHEQGLIKCEQALQELMQDARSQHDIENQVFKSFLEIYSIYIKDL
jgi:hypothetical protein